MFDLQRYKLFARAIRTDTAKGEIRFWAAFPRKRLPFGRICRLPGLVGFGSLSSLIHISAAGFRNADEGSLTLTYRVAGGSRRRIAGQACAQHAGQLLIARPYESATFTDDERFIPPGTALWLVMDVTAPGDAANPRAVWHWPDWVRMAPADLKKLEAALRRQDLCLVDADSRLAAAFLAIRDLARRDPPGPLEFRAANIVTGILYALLDALTDPRPARSPVEPEQFTRVAESLARRFMEPLTVNDLAHETGLNVPTFIKVFKKHFGLTPRQYIIQLRVKDAVRLMRTTDLPVAEIAQKVGFQSPTRLYVLVKKFHARTPAAFRKK